MVERPRLATSSSSELKSAAKEAREGGNLGSLPDTLLLETAGRAGGRAGGC
jgi:hypothetical protein